MADDQQAELRRDAAVDPSQIPVVGIGCSAGGLDAIRELLEGLGDSPGVCVVVLHHTDPSHEDPLPSILERSTELPVRTLETGDGPRRDTVLVVPPGKGVELDDGRFRLWDADRTIEHDIIDGFLSSLARAQGPCAVGVILSGSLTDGARGLREIQLAGGITFAQDTDTAQTPSMPRHAITSGAADAALAPHRIADRLTALFHDQAATPVAETLDPTLLDEVSTIVQDGTGTDLSTLPASTVARCIQRRRMVTGAATLEAYVAILKASPEEGQTLQDETLMHVTGVFREPDRFEALRDQVFDRFEEIAQEDAPIRVWVSGCGTGEDAYAIAIMLDEHLDARGIPASYQVFGTDTREGAVETARTGGYPARTDDELSPERRRRFFVEEGNLLRVRAPIRERCIFARHDLLEDPPFAEIDLIVFNEPSIPLDPDQRRRIAATLHYALSDGGILLDTSAEPLDPAEEMFTVLDPDHRILERKDLHPPPYLQEGHRDRPTHPDGAPADARRSDADPPSLERHADRILLERFVPAGVVVDDTLKILQFRGDVGRYLAPVDGDASLDLTRVAPHNLTLAVRSLVEDVKQTGQPQQRDRVHVQLQDTEHEITVRVLPIRVPPDDDPQAYIAVFVEDAPTAPARDGRGTGRRLIDTLQDLLPIPEPNKEERIRQLEADLEATRGYLGATIEEHEEMNEQLRTHNEEALATNEELQATNEELATAKEELQSANEQLDTVNAALTDRNDALEQVNDDLRNLLRSVELPILMLDRGLEIRRFTPPAEELFNLQTSDEGRPLTDLRHPFDDEDLESTVREVLDSLQMSTRQVETRDGDRYELRVRPYRTSEDEITGVVLMLWSMDQEATR